MTFNKQKENGHIAYLRVSTDKQGATGVSLDEQRLAIELYAEEHKSPITSWLTKTRTAGKVGRPIFKEILKSLRAGQAKGVVIHRIDRGTRNLWDWAALSCRGRCATEQEIEHAMASGLWPEGVQRARDDHSRGDDLRAAS